jgi:hypothetical protein
LRNGLRQGSERWRGKWALITGASAGIGRELARQLAAAGAHVVLTARRRERLEQLAAQIRSGCRVKTEVLCCDLARPGAPAEIFQCTAARDIPIEVLVNNAGFGAYGEFHKVPAARLLEMVEVNVSAVLRLTHLFLPQMIERGRGDILMVSSVAAFQAIPRYATYAATKSFELIFSEALAEEVRPHGIRVCTVCPGTTATEFQQVAGSPAHPMRKPHSAEEVARQALEAMAAGKTCKITGAKYWMAVQSQRVMPRGAAPRIAARLYRR